MGRALNSCSKCPCADFGCLCFAAEAEVTLGEASQHHNAAWCMRGLWLLKHVTGSRSLRVTPVDLPAPVIEHLSAAWLHERVEKSWRLHVDLLLPAAMGNKVSLCKADLADSLSSAGGHGSSAKLSVTS